MVRDYKTIFGNQYLLFYLQDYEGQNLVDVVGRDFGDYARQVMYVLFTEEELATCILPPKRRHLTREPLDSGRFTLLHSLLKMIFSILIFSLLFLEAVQIKYRLASYLYDDFFKYHLGPKLGDFLVAERRRQEKKNTRSQTSVAVSNATAQQPTID